MLGESRLKMKKPKEPKVIRITVEYDDGMIREAVGKDAIAVMRHWHYCETLASDHGWNYKGPFLQEVKPKGV